MLPGRSPTKSRSPKTRYAEEAIHEMFRRLAELGADVTGIRVFLVGGADVLGEGQEGPGAEIVQSVTRLLAKKGIGVWAQHVGGRQRRSCTLDLERGRVTYTVGNSGQQVLWTAELEESEA